MKETQANLEIIRKKSQGIECMQMYWRKQKNRSDLEHNRLEGI